MQLVPYLKYFNQDIFVQKMHLPFCWVDIDIDVLHTKNERNENFNKSCLLTNAEEKRGNPHFTCEGSDIDMYTNGCVCFGR
jgi:hypothetical protein